MADIYGSHFEYGGISSRKYNLIIANVNTERFPQISGTIEEETIFSKNSKKKYFIQDDYSSSPLEFDVEFITEDEQPLSLPIKRQVENWLFNRNNYCALYFDPVDDIDGAFYDVIDNEVKRMFMNCRFINAEKIENSSGVIGYRATLKSDSPFLWQDSIKKIFELNNPAESTTSNIDVVIDTDIDGFTYPIVKINMGTTAGDISIINHTDSDSRITKFVGLPTSAIVTMNGEINYISGQYYEKFYKQNFVRLLDGTNKLSITGNVKSIELEWKNRRRF